MRQVGGTVETPSGRGGGGNKTLTKSFFFLDIVPCPSLFPPVYLEDVWHHHHQYA